MDRIWFIIKENEHVGPYTVEELQIFLDDGKLQLSSLIWSSGMPGPLPMETVLDGVDEYFTADPKQSLPPENDLSDLGLEFSTLDSDPFYDPKEDEPVQYQDEIFDNEIIKVNKIETDQFQDSFDEDDLEVLLGQARDSIDLELVKDAPPQFTQPELELETDYECEVGDIEIIHQPATLDTGLQDVIDEFKHSQIEQVNYIETAIHFFQKHILRVAVAVPFLFIFILVGRLSTEVYQIYFSHFSIPAKMDIDQYELLALHLKKSKKITEAKAFFSKDYSTLWLATTYPFDGRVEIRIDSIPDKVLSEKPISATAVGLLQDKLISVSQFRFNQGERFSPGEYRIKFTLINRFKKSYWIEKLITLPALLEGETQLLVGPFDQVGFDVKLADYRKSREQDNLHFKQELKQRFETLKTINAEIHADLLKMMREVTEKNKTQLITQFETKWATHYGVFLTQFVLENDQFFKDLLNSTSTRTSSYYGLHTRLSQWCKQIGELSMQLVKEMKEEKNVKMYQSTDFRQTSTKQYENIAREITTVISEI